MRRLRLGPLAVLVVLAAPASAGAAATVGQVAPSPTTAVLCDSVSLFVSTQVAPGTPSYAAPEDGVITSWSAQGGLTAASELKFKVVRDQLDSYRIVGADPIERTVPPNTLVSFDVRIPAAAGDLIALWNPALGVCAHPGQAGDGLSWRDGMQPEPAIGDDFAFDITLQLRANVSAQLEPDADGDGYGDETQDGCPGNPLRQDDCTPPDTDTDPPETEITKGAPNKLDKSKVKFKFTADEPNVTFECKLDKKPYKPCTSPRKVKRLDDGKHKFKVIATDEAGNSDPSAAKDKFKVVD
jgi:hypothetical protein